MVTVRLVTNAGAGFPGEVEVKDGTTVGDLLRETLGTAPDPAKHHIRLNDQPTGLDVPLKSGDLLGIISGRYEGGFVAAPGMMDDAPTNKRMATFEGSSRSVPESPDAVGHDPSLHEIQAAIARLPRTDVPKLLIWLDEYHERLWDEQIGDDLEAGRLDGWLEEAKKERDEGLSRPL